jgi:hypothetical protein
MTTSLSSEITAAVNRNSRLSRLRMPELGALEGLRYRPYPAAGSG